MENEEKPDYVYEWKQLSAPITMTVSPGVMEAINRGREIYEHDVGLILGFGRGSMPHDALNCRICDRREPGMFPQLEGRWGEED